MSFSDEIFVLAHGKHRFGFDHNFSAWKAVDSKCLWTVDRFTLPAVHPDSTSLPERPDLPVWVSTQANPWFSLTAEASTPWHWREFMAQFRMHSSPGERIHDRGTAGTRLHSCQIGAPISAQKSGTIKVSSRAFFSFPCDIYEPLLQQMIQHIQSHCFIHHGLTFFILYSDWGEISVKRSIGFALDFRLTLEGKICLSWQNTLRNKHFSLENP